MLKPNRGWSQRGIIFPPSHMCMYITFNRFAFAIGAGSVIIWNLQRAKRVYALELGLGMGVGYIGVNGGGRKGDICNTFFFKNYC